MRRSIEQLLGRVVASDPSHQRLRLATRGTLAVGGAVGAVALLANVLGQPVLAAAPGVIVAMIGTLAVNDNSVRGRMTTLVLGVFSAFGGVAVGSLLAGAGVASYVVFVVAAGAATLAQRFGPRGMALGMLGFMSYFIAIFLRVPTSKLWWTALAIVCGAAISALVKEVLIRDRPVHDLHRTIDAFITRAAQVRRAVSAIAREGDDGIDGRRRGRLRRRVLILRETELAIDNQLGESEHEASLRVHDFVLHATLAAEALSESAVHGAGAEELAEQSHELAQIVVELRNAGRDAMPGDGGGASEDDEDDGESADDSGDDEDEPRDWPSPDIRKALQATVATGIAVPIGLLVSSQRWYWAAIGAFVIFTRPATAAESVVRGGERLLGTAVGAAAGIALGSAVRGHAAAQVVLLVIGVAASLYLFAVSYAFAMVGITAMLAIIYDLMGQFSGQVLELRVAETAIGVVLGGLAAMVVFPMSSRRKIREAEDDLLEELHGFLDEIAATRHASSGLRDRARDVEQKAHDLRTAAEPLAQPFPGLGSGQRRRRVIMLATLGRSARQLARVLSANPGATDDDAVRSDIAAVSRRLQAARSDDDGAGQEGTPVRAPYAEGPIGRELQRIARVVDSVRDDTTEAELLDDDAAPARADGSKASNR